MSAHRQGPRHVCLDLALTILTASHSRSQIEKAGGASSCDGKAVSALDIPILVCDQRTQICYGSIGEVRRFEEYMYGTSPRFSEKVAA